MLLRILAANCSLSASEISLCPSRMLAISSKSCCFVGEEERALGDGGGWCVGVVGGDKVVATGGGGAAKVVRFVIS